MNVGFSSLCIPKPLTYDFVSDVVGEIARLTPGPWFHIGGDEAMATKPADYVKLRRSGCRRSSSRTGSTWSAGRRSRARSSTRGRSRSTGTPGEKGSLSALAAKQGAKVIMSPAEHAYLDMKYDASTPIGLTWAGYTPVRDCVPVGPAARPCRASARADVLGVEAPLWGETTRTMADVEYLAFPRLIGIAEIGWSPARGRRGRSTGSGSARRRRCSTRLGVRFYRSPEVPWR